MSSVYTMKETCEKTGLSYETLKFYCNQGLVPNVKRDSRNHRVFDDRDIDWIISLNCLKCCGMSIPEMKAYIELCLLGESSIPQRQAILTEKREHLLNEKQRILESIGFIEWKLRFYEDVLAGKIKYYSSLNEEDL